MPEKKQLQKKVFCKLGTVLQIGYDYNAQCQVYKKLFFVNEFPQACSFQILGPGGVLER